MELANDRVDRGFPAIPTNELLPCRQQMTFPLIQRKIERMVVFMLWLLTFVTTLAAKNGAFVHHGNILVTAKMVICVQLQLLNQVNGGQIVHFSVSNSLIVASRCGQQLCLQPVPRRYPGSPLKPWQDAQLGLP